MHSWWAFISKLHHMYQFYTISIRLYFSRPFCSSSAMARRLCSEMHINSHWFWLLQNTSVAQTSVGVLYLSFMKTMKTHKCGLYVHHRHICAWPKHLNICISLFGEGQTLTFAKCDPGSYQTMKYRICDVLGMRKYASGECINNLSDLCLKHNFSHHTL